METYKIGPVTANAFDIVHVKVIEDGPFAFLPGEMRLKVLAPIWGASGTACIFDRNTSKIDAAPSDRARWV